MTTTRRPIDPTTASQFASELDCMRRRLSWWLLELVPRLSALDTQKIHKAVDVVAKLTVTFDSRFLRDYHGDVPSPFGSDATRAAGERLATLLASEAANTNSNGNAARLAGCDSDNKPTNEPRSAGTAP